MNDANEKAGKQPWWSKNKKVPPPQAVATVVVLRETHEHESQNTTPNQMKMANSAQFGAMYTELQALKGKEGVIKKLEFPDYENMESYNYQDSYELMHF